MADHEPVWGRGSYCHKRLLQISRSADPEEHDPKNNACVGWVASLLHSDNVTDKMKMFRIIATRKTTETQQIKTLASRSMYSCLNL